MPASRSAHSGAAPRQHVDLARLAFSPGPSRSEQRSRASLALTYSQRAAVASPFSVGEGGVRRRFGCQLPESSDPEPESSDLGSLALVFLAEQSGARRRSGRQLPESFERPLFA